jgi:hypothetical protein
MKQEFEKKQLLNDNDPAFGTYISNETEISSDTERLLRNSKQSRTKFSSFLPDTILQKKLITLRSTLLALSLTLTLFVFWLLDSLKDPVFATLVDGNLKKHQPLAKMASVGSTLVLVLFMEFVSHERNKRIRHEDVEILSKDDVLNGGGIWTRMNVGSSEIDGKVSQTTDSEDSGQIPFAVFKIVGICYTIAFCLISYVLRQHRSFSNNLIPTMDQSEHAAWYIIGYLQYITIESFGSIGVAKSNSRKVILRVYYSLRSTWCYRRIDSSNIQYVNSQLIRICLFWNCITDDSYAYIWNVFPPTYVRRR